MHLYLSKPGKMSRRLVWINYHVLCILLVTSVERPPSILGQAIDHTGECDEGAVNFDSDDCASYFQCLNGVVIKQKCPDESYFDSKFEVCVIDVNFECISANKRCLEGELQEDPKNCAAYFKCINGQLVVLKCDDGSYFNPTLKVCLIDENGICDATTGKCLEGELQADPNNCNGYLKCINGKLMDLKCDDDTYFNPMLKVCIIDENGICDPTTGKCFEGKLQEDPKNCDGYLKCINGKLVDLKCDEGSYFNPTLKVCIIDENGICDATTGKCLEGELQADPNNCNGYLKCINGQLVVLKCDDGSYFNPALKICLIDENGICDGTTGKCFEGEFQEDPKNCDGYLNCINGKLVDLKCGDGRNINSTLTGCLLDENGICTTTAEKCTEGEVVEVSEDCSAFLQCINGELIKRQCSSVSFFDTTLGSCMVDVDGVCAPLSDNCAEGERNTDPVNCASYLECIDGDFVEQTCSSGCYFDSNNKTCVADENFVCVSNVK